MTVRNKMNIMKQFDKGFKIAMLRLFNVIDARKTFI